MLAPETISSVFNGLLLLVTGLTALTAARSRQRGISRKLYRALERKYLAVLGYAFELETALATRGIPRPARPAELEDDEDDERPLPGLPPHPRTPAGP